MSIKSNEKGYVTLYNVIDSGFVPFGSDPLSPSYETINLNDILDKLYAWLKDPERDFQNTSPLDKTDGRLDSITYCKSLYKCQETKDLFFVLWKSVTDGNGNIQGVKPDSSVNDETNNTTLLNEKDAEKKLIWGLPSYYWYISELNVFATIKFPHSCTDKSLFERYIRDFVLFRMTSLPGRKEFLYDRQSINKRDYKYYQVTFGEGLGRFRFKIESKQLIKQSGKDYFSQLIGNKYNYLVIRDRISAIDSKNKQCWFNSLVDPLKKKKPNIKTKDIEVIMPSYLESFTLEEIYEYYEERKMGTSEWSNIGFREKRDSATKWCEEFIARDFISCDLGDKATDNHLSALKLCAIINSNRNMLLHNVLESKNKQLEEIAFEKKNKQKAKKNKQKAKAS